MTMEHYFASLTISTTPKDNLQASLNSKFYNAPNLFIIEEEKTYEQTDWQNVDVLINSVTDSQTDQKLNEDFKELIFLQIDHIKGRGYKYRFNNDIYLCIDISGSMLSSSTVVRRCNQTLKSSTFAESCIATNVRNFDSLQESTYMSMPDGKLNVIVQYNSNTQTIKYGDRFILGNQVYEVVGIDDVSNVFNDKGLLYLTVERTTRLDTDNFVSDVADNNVPTAGTTDLW